MHCVSVANASRVVNMFITTLNFFLIFFFQSIEKMIFLLNRNKFVEIDLEN